MFTTGMSAMTAMSWSRPVTYTKTACCLRLIGGVLLALAVHLTAQAAGRGSPAV
jgi:hypothetical protein